MLMPIGHVKNRLQASESCQQHILSPTFRHHHQYNFYDITKVNMVFVSSCRYYTGPYRGV